MILDTSVLITAERGAALDRLIEDDDDVAIAAITAAELWVGVELADERRRPHRSLFVEQIVASIPSIPYELETALAHSRMLADARRSGRPRGAHDLVIAATAVASERVLVTRDRHGFEGIEGLALRAPRH